MKTLIKSFLLATVSALAISSCREPETPMPKPIGGKGGNATFLVTPKHHGKNIDSCMVYIKYNTTTNPGKGNFDDSAKCIMTNSIPVATFSGLKAGDYYLFGYGYDPGLGEAVEGGRIYSITEEKSYGIDLSVTEEGH